MINLRYHIVSITAVFLALGIGVALGSTFLDRATVDVLDRNIRSAENRIDETNAENARLTRELEEARDRDDALILTGSEELLSEQLSEVPVLVIAAPGTDGDDTAAISTILERSDADVRGVLRLRDELLLDGEVDEQLAADLGVEGTSAEELQAEVYEQLRVALAAAGADPDDADGAPAPEVTTTTTAPAAPGVPGEVTTTTTEVPSEDELGATEPDGSTPGIVETLLERDYLQLEVADGASAGDPILEQTGYRYVFVGAPDLTSEQNDVLLSLLGEGSGAPALPGTVISATQPPAVGEEQQVPTVVARVRAAEDLTTIYNTVDDADWFAGLVATVFSLERIGDLPPGHYGLADGATAVLPETP
jgi:hypothetical protein